MPEHDDKDEIARLRTLLAATEELLTVHEQAVLEQSDRLENTLEELTKRQHQLENLARSLSEARDQAVDALKVRSRFLANMSHEIRTPISSVIGMTELLLDSALNPQQRRFAEVVRDSAQSLLVIINDILDFSKMEAKRVEPSPVEFNPLEVISSAAELARPRAVKKGLKLRTYSDPGIPKMVHGDALRFRQVLTNLIDNAVKFTASGEVAVRTAIEQSTSDTVRIRVSVIDTGIGMSEEAREKIFNPFVQADGSTTRQFGGTGLGLSICKSLVELLGGTIGCESKAGEGSNFWFVLPFACPQQPAKVGPDLTRDTMEIDRRLLATRVLVAEDNAALQELAIRQLSKLGYAAHGVASGKEAVDAVAAGRFELILMDCQMPDMDGLTATQAIRSMEAGSHKHIPIVAMTASANSADKDKCLEAGMDDFLSKPVTLDALNKILLRWMSVNRANSGAASSE